MSGSSTTSPAPQVGHDAYPDRSAALLHSSHHPLVGNTLACAATYVFLASDVVLDPDDDAYESWRAAQRTRLSPRPALSGVGA